VKHRDEAEEHHTLLEYYLGGKRRLPLLKEEFWQDASGQVTRYSLAYIDPLIFPGDNGRVLGYDNAHGLHHRHFMGVEGVYEFTSYEKVLAKFEAEVGRIRRGDVD
jgi:hypothetical protein